MMINGENLLKTLITSSNGKYNPIRNFTVEELKKATNNYSQNNFVKSDAICKLYKGFQQERSVYVMKFGDEIRSSLDGYECCFNNIAFASQMNQKNVLKLIGC
ncbi:hypothetical protein Ddye_028164 [Dipteronia dyeriana]|uniref:Uncharacterized protein n=1 Tax=Dipteronia dyeriana TaxID=168575 RepID=A0AAD9TRE7_9ROSI|nr:hypothetical protein Ddye_028164 [Dipteronia dyeriana]